MVDEPELEPEPMDRRSREQARRAARSRRMGIVGSVLAAGIVALVALVATDTLRVGGSGPTLAGGKSTVSTTTVKTNANQDVTKLKKTQPARALSHDKPLRLWIGGDSLSGELGYQLGPMLAKLGIVKTHVDYKVSSGLANNLRNWPEHFKEEEAQYEPEAAIFMVGANDASIVGSATDAVGAPAWESKYRAEVDEMMDLLVGGAAHRTVFWVGDAGHPVQPRRAGARPGDARRGGQARQRRVRRRVQLVLRGRRVLGLPERRRR
jgi:hypothetical protein